MFYQGHVEPYRVLIKGEEHSSSDTKLIRKFSKRIVLPKKKVVPGSTLTLICIDDTTYASVVKLDKLFRGSDYRASIESSIVLSDEIDDDQLLTDESKKRLISYIRFCHQFGQLAKIKMLYLTNKETPIACYRRERITNTITDTIHRSHDDYTCYKLESHIVFKPSIKVEGITEPIEL